MRTPFVRGRGSKRAGIIRLGFFAAAALEVVPAMATPLYWDANGAAAGAGSTPTGTWGSSAYWSTDSGGASATSNVTTTSLDDLYFVAGPGAGSGNSLYTVTVASTSQAAHGIIAQSSGDITFSAGTISLGAGGLTGSQYAYGTTNRGFVGITSTIKLQADQDWTNNGSNDFNIVGAVQGTGNLNFKVNDSGIILAYASTFNPIGSITNSGTGTGRASISSTIGTNVTGITQNSSSSGLTLSGNNTFTAGVRILAGTVTLNNKNGLGTGVALVGDTAGGADTGITLNSVTSNVANGITIRSGNTGTSTLDAGATSGYGFSGTITLEGGRGVTLKGGNQGGFTGKITQSGGNSGVVTIETGSNTMVFGNAASDYTGGTVITGNGEISLQTGSSGSFFGSGSLTVNGGTFKQSTVPVTLGGISSLILNTDFNVSGKAALTVNAPVDLGATGSDTARTITNTGPLTLSGVISNGTNGITTGIIKSGGQPLTLGGVNTFTGNVVIQSGSLILNGDAPSESAGTLGNSTAAVFLGHSSGIANASLIESSNYTIARNIIVQSGNTGVMSIGGNSTTNSTSVFSGKITLGSGGLSKNVTLTAGLNHTEDFTGVIENAAGVAPGSGGAVTKSGLGTVRLSNTNTYTGSTTVSAGTLLVTGTINTTSGVSISGSTFEYGNDTTGLTRNVTVGSGGKFKYNSSQAYTGSLTLAGGSVSGSGNLGSTVLGGSGSIDPGNSPGLIVAGATDPSGGLDFNFEFTLKNSAPTWGAVENDVLRLTGVTPFAAAMNSGNVFTLYLSSGIYAGLTDGDFLEGGFYVDAGEFLGSVSGATIVAYYADTGGSQSYNGQTYTLLSVGNFSVTTTEDGAFSGTGKVSRFTYSTVPEPSTWMLMAGGLVVMGCRGLLGKRVRVVA